jgi:hypothetical protein
VKHGQTEVELKFVVPQAMRARVLRELQRGASEPPVRMSMAAMYLDTPDRRLAAAGMAWRLRREGRRWVQTLKTQGSNPLERFEHETARPGASIDVSAHAGTPARRPAIVCRSCSNGHAPKAWSRGCAFGPWCTAPPAGFVRVARSSRSLTTKAVWWPAMRASRYARSSSSWFQGRRS